MHEYVVYIGGKIYKLTTLRRPNVADVGSKKKRELELMKQAKKNKQTIEDSPPKTIHTLIIFSKSLNGYVSVMLLASIFDILNNKHILLSPFECVAYYY